MALIESGGAIDCVTVERELDALFKPENRLLIVVHNNPDPDAIASASALKFFLERRYGLEASVAYGGAVGRAENRTMVKRLGIKMKRLARLKLKNYDRLAFVDTQPGAGNHALPPGRKCHLVIDHHPRRRTTRADLVIVQPEIGATATILAVLLKTCGVEIPSALATALSYAISSETQNMKREASRLDIEAYLWVYPQSRIRILGEIIHPRLRHSHYETLLKALKAAEGFRTLICVHLGDVPQPEIVSEMADYFLRHERIGWVLATGRFRGNLVLSLRASSGKKSAGTVIRRIVKDSVNAGGHDLVAGGFIPAGKMRREEIDALERRLTADFASVMGYTQAEWKRLLEPEKPAEKTGGNDVKEIPGKII
ncbi:MAG: DHH family phosphoesterase [Spirochaetales bacterium]|nr:DHH family phosphoesterase [Spirochaetales bacterium]